MRAFIAIDLNPEVRNGLKSLIANLKSQIPSGVRWSAVENIHLTLKFLGESSPSRLEGLRQGLPAVVQPIPPFEFSLEGLGAFPNFRRPRVIWVGIQSPPALAELRRRIEKSALDNGYPLEERDFSPHLTLGRVQPSASTTEVAAISAALAQAHIGCIGKVAVQKVILFHSDLQPAGPVYTPLGNFPLG